MQTVDLEAEGLRHLNKTLGALGSDTNQPEWEVVNPRGAHAIAVGLDALDGEHLPDERCQHSRLVATARAYLQHLGQPD